MDKKMLRFSITQVRQTALMIVGMSLLTACGGQSGMKLGDDEFSVMSVIRQFLIRLQLKVCRILKFVRKCLVS